jgi:hypothetical protein
MVRNLSLMRLRVKLNVPSALVKWVPLAVLATMPLYGQTFIFTADLSLTTLNGASGMNTSVCSSAPYNCAVSVSNTESLWVTFSGSNTSDHILVVSPNLNEGISTMVAFTLEAQPTLSLSAPILFAAAYDVHEPDDADKIAERKRIEEDIKNEAV